MVLSDLQLDNLPAQCNTYDTTNLADNIKILATYGLTFITTMMIEVVDDKTGRNKQTEDHYSLSFRC